MRRMRSVLLAFYRPPFLIVIMKDVWRKTLTESYLCLTSGIHCAFPFLWHSRCNCCWSASPYLAFPLPCPFVFYSVRLWPISPPRAAAVQFVRFELCDKWRCSRTIEGERERVNRNGNEKPLRNLNFARNVICCYGKWTLDSGESVIYELNMAERMMSLNGTRQFCAISVRLKSLSSK